MIPGVPEGWRFCVVVNKICNSTYPCLGDCSNYEQKIFGAGG